MAEGAQGDHKSMASFSTRPNSSWTWSKQISMTEEEPAQWDCMACCVVGVVVLKEGGWGWGGGWGG